MLRDRFSLRRIALSRGLHHRLFLILGSLLAMPAMADWPALQKLQAERGVTVSALVQDLGSGETLSQLGAQRRLSPASLTKLVLASAVLETWPGDHRFLTRVQGVFPDAQGRVAGDLWLSGEGDPSFEHRDLWLLAARIKQAGVRRVDGDIVASALPFGRLDCETQDRCDALERTRTAYDAPLAAIGVDYGTWCIDLTPRLPGQPAGLQHCAAFEVPIPQLGSITSRPPRRAAAPWMDRRSWAGEDQLVMGGDLSRPTRLYRSMGDPALGAALLLRQALAELGVAVPGAVRVSDFPPPAGLPELSRHEGAPIREQVAGLLRYSNNYISDVLTLGLALGRTPEPVTSLAQASRLLEARLLRARAAAGLPTLDDAAPVMLSGSGLTPENRLSAEDLVALLQDEYRQTARFPRFYAGLVVPGEAPNALLRRGNAAWRERVALKTGTLSVPRSVFGTAGYLRKRDGGWMAFAVIVNGAERKPVPMSVSLEAIRRDVEALLARY
jgi:serine-type D-Ala-D-Ala carboxypeptidase/endopeptidase (penicillin-binding protein 4)